MFLTGRNPAALDPVAGDIARSGGAAQADRVDGLDEQAVESHAAAVVKEHGAIDISFNAIGIPQPGIQGLPLVELPVESFHDGSGRQPHWWPHRRLE